MDELKGLQKKTDQSIEIEEFIPIEKVDPVYFETTQLLDAVLEAVDRKVAGEEIVVMPKEEARDQIIDLVAALKKSLADKQGGGSANRKPARKKAARKASKKKSASS